MSMSLYAIYGASGCGRSIMPVARQQLEAQGVDPDRLVFIDDSPAKEMINGQRVLVYDDFMNEEASDRFVAIAISDSKVRERLAAKCSADQIPGWTIRADNVVTMDDAEIGEGALLSPFVTITSNIQIGKFFHANLYSYVEHDCRIGDFVTFAPGVKCNGNVVIEDHAYIGSGAILRQGTTGSPLRIGRGAVVGMGAVVTGDVAAGVTVVGNPARPMTEC
jgi:sugar O-acyltransferase (sialic acid O-acetyltransferase NeuD family)